MLDFTGSGIVKTEIDEYCYDLNSIASYVQEHFQGKTDVPLDDIWKLLDRHPVFPSDGYRNQIKDILRDEYQAKVRKKTISFSEGRG